MSDARIVVGTAGHVDHGKTRLVQALTGIDTDRLPEEKRRGMTIVPGFVPLDLPSGRRLGLVDVPGHERFVKNMLCGAAGIDMALLVVAADEGVMPQTAEHLNILRLLGIERVVVALTKCELADEALLALARAEVAELLAGTRLKGAPILDVSAVTGYHIPELLALLDKVAGELVPKRSGGPCRMPVDRVFSKPGFGAVATGTLWAGAIETGARLILLPSGDELRVRGLQVHGAPVMRAAAGQRVAVNLAGPETERVNPGAWLCAPGALQASYRLHVAFDFVSTAKAPENHSRLRVFHGTSEVFGRLRLPDQLRLETPLFPLPGDRLILRTLSPAVTVAGATVLEPPRNAKGSEEFRQRETLKFLADYHKKYPLRRGMPLAELRQRASGDLSAFLKDGSIALDGTQAALADFVCAPAEAQRADLDAIETAYRERLFTPPEFSAVTDPL
ncbi:MAG: selenocysteine-specific translation elongation factor, partial [Firmicutes bacterium]|nr:selenocysteine-specific translation elongation factor [Bacillota bacterium]